MTTHPDWCHGCIALDPGILHSTRIEESDGWQSQLGLEDGRPFIWLTVTDTNRELTPDQARELGIHLIRASALLAETGRQS